VIELEESVTGTARAAKDAGRAIEVMEEAVGSFKI
jgi:hypothetical protein